MNYTIKDPFQTTMTFLSKVFIVAIFAAASYVAVMVIATSIRNGEERAVAEERNRIEYEILRNNQIVINGNTYFMYYFKKGGKNESNTAKE